MAFVSIDKMYVTPLSHRIADVFANLRQDMANNRMYRRTLRELGALSDRELNDLGLCRSSIRDVAARAVYEK